MRIIREILDRLILLAAILLASCVPSFIVQYRQRLGGRLEQIHADLAPFQAIADRNFGGNLAMLIDHNIASRDPTFHQEGVAIQTMVDAAARLRDAVQALDTDLLHQCLYLLTSADPGLVQSTWNIYQPGFTLTLQGALFALGVGFVVWLLFLAIWNGIAVLLRPGHRPPRAKPPPPPPRLNRRGPEPRVGLD